MGVKYLILLYFFVFLFSCDVSKKVISTKDLNIIISKTKCGSYDVKNNEILIGYIVKPFVTEIDRKKDYINQVEKLLQVNYSDYYNKFYRVYWFSKDNVSDIILQVVMLSSRQTKSIPYWECEEQDIDVYTQHRKRLFNVEHPQFIIYNCTKGRFKVLGDPD